MTLFRRFLFFVVLATYVAGLGVFAASATAMAGNMVLGEAGEMGDCQGCDPSGGDGPASACDTPCLAPMMATTLSPDTAFPALLSEPARAAVDDRFASLTGPPDPSPPRPIILN
jgi:hypothetical protein